ncbi:hypothetical protein [Acinetobacter sp. CFCC 10889]|uniref:hypothetical protein n=1 Tax=Acinetobacter sp. CFCC 10889 TaxID=1775557 RepID=UPI000DD0C4DA|nr:hypothetical protein [Acinetobacter sp. CFCC 10889]
MVSDLDVLANYKHTFAFDGDEAVLKAIFIRIIHELFDNTLNDIHHYGMPHLGGSMVVERFTKQDGLAVIRRPQDSDLIMRIIYANWRSMASKRGFTFLEFILTMLWANKWEIMRLYHSYTRREQYPKHVVEIDSSENFLTSRIFVLIDGGVDVNELRQLTPTLQRLVPANIVATVGIRMNIKPFDVGVAAVMKSYSVARFY